MSKKDDLVSRDDRNLPIKAARLSSGAVTPDVSVPRKASPGAYRITDQRVSQPHPKNRRLFKPVAIIAAIMKGLFRYFQQNHPFLFSRQGVLAVVALLGLSCWVIVHTNQLSARLMFSLALAYLFWAMLAAFLSRGTTRAFWFAVSVVGIGYFAITAWPLAPSLHEKLITTHVIDSSYYLVRRSEIVRDAPWIDDIPYTRWVPDETDYKMLGHSLFVIVLSLISGVCAKHLHIYKTRQIGAKSSTHSVAP
jgi:hypothetical protein